MGFFRFVRTAHLPAALAAAVLALVPARFASAQVYYPRLALPSAIYGSGIPYLDSLGQFNVTTLDAVARFDQVVVDASPITEYHPEILTELRRRNPRIQLFAYVVGENIWDVNAADSLVHYPTRYNHLVRDMGGFLYDKQGRHYPNMCVNLALKDSNGRYVMAEALANLFYDAIVSTGIWDGMYVDVFPDDIAWSQTPSESIDVRRAGYADQASFDTGWYAGTEALANRLRLLVGPTFILVGNGGIGHKYAAFNGWTREDFPNQEGGTWSTNMFWDPGGYFTDEQRFRAPVHNQIVSIAAGTNMYDANNMRKVRYALATASLGTGYASFEPLDRAYTTPPLEQWWYDEYAVDVATGQSMTDLSHTHWLGQALGAPYQMVWVGTNPEAITNPGFETNVTSGWTFGKFTPAVATLSRDTTTAAVGHASAHVAIAVAGTLGWDVNMTSTGSLAMYPGNHYSATFWARASARRDVPVVATLSIGGQVASQTVTVDTTWHQYQVVLEPNQPAVAVLEFFLGTQAGDVWFDDVHFQAGETSLWRRDFENGIVLVNPGLVPLTVPLGATFRHIQGLRDTAVNNGTAATSVVVNPSDALFLVGSPRDLVPPNAIDDARVQP